MLKTIIRENHKLLIRALVFYGVFIVAALVFIRPPLQMVLGLTFGALVAILNFLEMALTLRSAMLMPPRAAQSFALIKFVMRYVLTGGVLLVSFISPIISPIGTIAGLLVVKGGIFSTYLFRKNASEHQKN